MKSGKEKILKCWVKKDGYIQIRLNKYGKGKKYYVHRLVAEAFIPNPDNLPEVNHKDENKQNNFVYINEDGTVDLEKSNLEYCDHLYNCNYGTRNKRVSESRFKPVLQIDKNTNNVITEFPSLSEINRQFGYSQGHIKLCLILD